MMVKDVIEKISAPSLEQLADEARSVARLYREQSLEVGITFRQAWQDLRPTLQEDGDWFWTDEEAFHKFSRQARLTTDLMPSQPTDDLAINARYFSRLKPDWKEISAFMLHDLNYLRIINLLEMIVMIENRASDKGRPEIHRRQVYFLDTLAQDAEEQAALIAYPCDFVASVADLELGRRLPIENFRPLDDLKRLGVAITGRFAVEDFQLIVNNSESPDLRRNRLIVECPADLTLNANRAMLVLVIYNLLKNSAKATSQRHYDDQLDQAMPKLYYRGGQLNKPREIAVRLSTDKTLVTISVEDQGGGVSLDRALERFRRELSSRVISDGFEATRQSEWFRQMVRSLGQRQANLFLAWPKNPFALRGVTVGSLLDVQFIAGFSGISWDIQSVTSGMGLWGVRYLTEHLGGLVVGTNSLEGGANFNVTIPRARLGLSSPITWPLALRYRARSQEARIAQVY